jgi:hypothetical protein
MRRSVLTLTILPAMLLSSVLVAQDLDKPSRAVGPSPAVDQVAQTETMWFYLQELRRYDDPQAVIRRKAEKKGDQRRQRLAAMKWFGWSQSRPTASSTPWTAVYSPSWVGNGADPYQWVGNAYLTTAIRVDTGDSATRR